MVGTIHEELAAAFREAIAGGMDRDAAAEMIQDEVLASVAADLPRPVGWRLGVVRAAAEFGLADPAEVERFCHFTNLRPVPIERA